MEENFLKHWMTGKILEVIFSHRSKTSSNFLNIHKLTVFLLVIFGRPDAHGTEANKVKASASSPLTTRGWFCSKPLYPLAGMNILILRGGRSLRLELFNFENEQSSKSPPEFKQGNQTLKVRVMRPLSHVAPGPGWQHTDFLSARLAPTVLLCSHSPLLLHALFLF